jgi:hypothetical protein
MSLSRAQRRVLTAYRRFHDQGGPRLTEFLGWPTLCYVVGAALILFGTYLLGELHWISAFFLGFAIGAIYIKATQARRSIQAWPTITIVVNWEVVDSLLENDDHSRPTQ